jgi:alanine racemase
MTTRPGTVREPRFTPKFAGLDDCGSSLITLEVNLSVYRDNLRAISAHVAPARLIAVVKANAYGFGVAGLLPVLGEFEQVSLGVANADEALELRSLGYNGRILLLGYTHPKNYYQIIHSGCQLAAFRPENIPELAAACRQLDHPLELHIKVDTGMARLGIAVDELAGFIRELRRYPQIAIVGLFSHLVSSDAPEAEINAQQEARFARAIEIASAELGYRPECHLANSAAVQNLPRTHHDSVRVGLLAYGVGVPALHEASVQVAPCFRLSSEVIDLHRLQPGEGVSYCHNFIARRPSTIATLPFGYADGLPRRLSNRAQVLLHGRCCPLIGNVTMDYVMADVTELDGGVQLGDEAVFIGTQSGPAGESAISIEEVARLAGTLPYEISCAWGRRVRRVYCE